MPYYIELNEDGRAVAVTETSAELAPAPQRVPVDGLCSDLLGQVYDPQASAAAGQPVFVAPPAPPAQVFNRLTKLGFRGRFRHAEKTTIELASLDNPASPMAQRAQAADVRVYLADVASATYIDPQRAETRAGVQALEAAGLIGPGRALEILDAPIQAPEAYTGQV